MNTHRDRSGRRQDTQRAAGRRGHRVKSRARRVLVGGGALASVAAATVAVSLASASQYGGDGAGADRAVFVQGNELDGNTVHVARPTTAKAFRKV